MKKRRVLLLVREDHVPPDSIEGLSDKEIKPWKGEFDVKEGLAEQGHAVSVLGVDDDLESVRHALKDVRPHIVFNLLEEFAREQSFVAYLLGYLEMLGQPYTGCSPDKARQQRALRQHRIPTPGFFEAPRGRKVRRPARMDFPLIVKSQTSHGSMGITQASVVFDDAALRDRVESVHDTMDTDAIVERFIQGRELYIGVMGNKRLEHFPVWELRLENLPANAPFVATEKVKWDLAYQERVGLETGPAMPMPDGAEQRVIRTARRAYRALEQSGYARMDFRLTDDGQIYLIESNPNPDLTFGEDFAKSAELAGLEYPRLLERIISLGERWARRAP